MIMFSLPLAVVGAFGLLAVTGNSLNMMSMIGMILLTGLVGKNAILLVDFTNTLRKRGLGRNEALLQAGPTRLRPILMTTSALVLAMSPIALKLGEGSEWRAPMAVTVIGGLLTSTLLTLVLIPAVYTIMDDFQGLVSRSPKLVQVRALRMPRFRPQRPGARARSATPRTRTRPRPRRRRRRTDGRSAARPIGAADSPRPRPRSPRVRSARDARSTCEVRQLEEALEQVPLVAADAAADAARQGVLIAVGVVRVLEDRRRFELVDGHEAGPVAVDLPKQPHPSPARHLEQHADVLLAYQATKSSSPPAGGDMPPSAGTAARPCQASPSSTRFELAPIDHRDAAPACPRSRSERSSFRPQIPGVCSTSSDSRSYSAR